MRRPAGSQREKPQLLKRALIEVGRSLEADHIDGDFLNNAPGNLRFLCPDCHRLTPNFAGRGKGRFTQALDDVDGAQPA